MPKKAEFLTAEIIFTKILVLLTVFTFLLPGFLNAAPAHYNVRSLSVDDGLSQSMVYCILQDNRGFIWLGTQDGLNRYDGKTVKVYRHNPDVPGTPSDDRYFAIWQAPDYKIWFATNEGLDIYDPSLDRFSPFVAKITDRSSDDSAAKDGGGGGILLPIGRK